MSIFTEKQQQKEKKTGVHFNKHLIQKTGLCLITGESWRALNRVHIWMTYFTNPELLSEYALRNIYKLHC